MANPLLLDIVTFLKQQGVIEGDGIDTFRDFIPEQPDNLVSVTEYKGSPVEAFDPTVHRSVQVSIRDKSADTARSKALLIFKTFQESIGDSRRVDLTDDRWGQVYLRQSPFRLSTDSSDRVTYAFNIGITTNIE